MQSTYFSAGENLKLNDIKRARKRTVADRQIHKEGFYIYFYYDEAGILLYVGKSKNISSRHSSHKNDKWFPRAKTIGLRRYNNIIDMNMAEPYYIALLQPIFNIEFLRSYDPARDGLPAAFHEYTEEIRYNISEFSAMLKNYRKEKDNTLKKKSISPALKKRSSKELTEVGKEFTDVRHTDSPTVEDILYLLNNPKQTAIENMGKYFYIYCPAKGLVQEDVYNEAKQTLITSWERESTKGQARVEIDMSIPASDYIPEFKIGKKAFKDDFSSEALIIDADYDLSSKVAHIVLPSLPVIATKITCK